MGGFFEGAVLFYGGCGYAFVLDVGREGCDVGYVVPDADDFPVGQVFIAFVGESFNSEQEAFAVFFLTLCGVKCNV